MTAPARGRFLSDDGKPVDYEWRRRIAEILPDGKMRVAPPRPTDIYDSSWNAVFQRPLPPEEDAVSIDAAIALRDRFATESPAVRALFDALVDLLTGGERKH